MFIFFQLCEVVNEQSGSCANKKGIFFKIFRGKLLRVNIYSDDVTQEYRDASIRLENKLKARERYLDLLKKAENIQAAIKVEAELERLNGEIESFKGNIKRISHLAAYSTITVSLKQKTTPGPVGYIFWGLYKVAKWLFIWD